MHKRMCQLRSENLKHLDPVESDKMEFSDRMPGVIVASCTHDSRSTFNEFFHADIYLSVRRQL